jgi:hypothetical protein
MAAIDDHSGVPGIENSSGQGMIEKITAPEIPGPPSSHSVVGAKTGDPGTFDET